jgi:hypothetical protein
LDIGAKTPEEIALSIMSEIVLVRRGGSGQAMLKAKGVQIRKGTFRATENRPVRRRLGGSGKLTTEN